MLRKTTAILLVTMFAVFFSVNHLQAQLYTPFIDFVELEPDYQFFAHHEGEWASVLFLPLVARYVLWDVLVSILLTPLIFALLTVGERAPSRA